MTKVGMVMKAVSILLLFLCGSAYAQLSTINTDSLKTEINKKPQPVKIFNVSMKEMVVEQNKVAYKVLPTPMITEMTKGDAIKEAEIKTKLSVISLSKACVAVKVEEKPIEEPKEEPKEGEGIIDKIIDFFTK